MKKYTFLVVLGLLTLVFLISCKKEADQGGKFKTSILPKNWGVDIPSSISYYSSTKNINDTLNGNEIYQNLRTFINVGEKSAEIVQNIMIAISVHDINEAISLTYTSNDDGRAKYLEVLENESFDGQNWEYEMTISDASSTSEADQGKALQIFWNTSPIKGIAILKPYNIDRTTNLDFPDFIVKIYYSEAGEGGYDSQMTVDLKGLPNISDRYYLNSLKMFAGKNDNIVSVYGNSDHPNAYFFDTSAVGFNWAFSASSNNVLDIAVAEVGLPRNTLNSTNRDEILVTNSIYNVFNNQILSLGYSQEDTDNYLFNTSAPGYFNSNGFIQGGTAPNGYDFTVLQQNVLNLTPYNPLEINNLNIDFKWKFS